MAPWLCVSAGDGSVEPTFGIDSAVVSGTRYFSAWYWVNATNLQGCYAQVCMLPPRIRTAGALACWGT